MHHAHPASAPSLALLLIALASCGGGAGELVRPKDFTAGDALGGPAPACTGGPKLARPLIIDLDPDARVDLEAAMKKGVVVVAYDCNTLRALPSCEAAEVGYDYVGVNRKEQVVQLKGADELRVNLPLSANKLSAEVQAGRSIDLGLVYVGRRTTVVSKVRRDELRGACEGATHYLRNATVGAFALSTSSEGKVAAAAELFQVGGGSAKSESSRRASSSDGSLEACRKSDASSTAPPAECGAPLRVELLPIGDAPGGPAAKPAKPDGDEKDDALDAKKSQSKRVEENPCREGYVLADGACTRSTGAAHLCDPRDVEECKAQCEKGDAGSCLNYGTHVYLNVQGGDASPYFKRACDGGDAEGCASLAQALVPALTEVPQVTYAQATELAKKSCAMGSGGGCFWAAHLMGNEKQAATFDEKGAFGFYQRGCGLGYKLSCRSMAESYIYGRGVTASVAKGLEAFTKACQGDDEMACTQLVTHVEPSDPERALRVATKTCELYPQSYGCLQTAELLAARGQHDRAYPYAKKACDVIETWCQPLIKMYQTGKGAKKDPAAAQALVDKLCGHELADDALCKQSGARPKPKGKGRAKKK